MTEPRSSTWLSPPGDTIGDLLEERNWSKQELAKRLECTPEQVTELLKGAAPIHTQLALELSRVLGSTPEFWLSREVRYRLALQRQAASEALVGEAGWAADYQINKLNNTIKDLKTQLAIAKRVNETGLLSLPGTVSDLYPMIKKLFSYITISLIAALILLRNTIKEKDNERTNRGNRDSL